MPKLTAIHPTVTATAAAIFLCSFLVAVAGRGQLNPYVACDDVSTIDFNNGALDLGGFGMLTFKGGRACGNEEVSIHQDRNCPCGSGKCDWEMRISEDTLLEPEPSRTFRLLNVFEKHLTGSGAWGHLLLFECRNGQLEKVMDKQYLYGLSLTPTAEGFDLESNYYLPKDARRCPSRKQKETYGWSSSQHKYVRIRRTVLKRNAATE
jgi:hypothetical protein